MSTESRFSLSRQSGIYQLQQELEEVDKKDPIQFVDVYGLSQAHFEEIAEAEVEEDDDEVSSHHSLLSSYEALPDGAKLAKVIKDESLTSIASQLKQLENECQKSISKKSKQWAEKEGAALKSSIKSDTKQINALKSNIKSTSDVLKINSLEEELFKIQSAMDVNKRALYFPNSPITLGSNGLFIGLDDIWLENLCGSFSLTLEPGATTSKIVFILRGKSNSEQGLEAKLRLDGLKLKSDKSILNLSLKNVQLEIGIKVRIEIHYNVEKKEFSSKTFDVEILRFKGSFGITRSIVSGVLAMTIPIIKYKLFGILPFELGQLISELPHSLNVEGHFDISEKFPLDGLQNAMYKSENVCQAVGFSPMQIVMFVGLQKSMDRKNKMKTVFDLISYQRKYQSEEQWEVLKILWDQACVVYYSRILNQDISSGGQGCEGGGVSQLSGENTNNEGFLSFEKLLLGLDEITNHPMDIHFSLSNLDLKVNFNSVLNNVVSFFNRWSESLTHQNINSVEFKRDLYVQSQLKSQLLLFETLLKTVKRNLLTSHVSLQVSLLGGPEGSLTAVLDDIQALGSLALYIPLPRDCDIGYDFSVPVMTNIRAIQDGVISIRMFHLGCNEMLEKANFERFKVEYDRDPNFAGLHSLQDFQTRNTMMYSEKVDQRHSVLPERLSDRNSVLRSSRLPSMQDILKKQSTSGQNFRQSMSQMVRVQEELLKKQCASKIKCGWLTKKGHIFKTWCKRWFVLNKGTLRYYQSSLEKFPYGQGLKGEISLGGYSIECLSENVFELRPTEVGGKEFFIEANDEHDLDLWIEALDLHIQYWHREGSDGEPDSEHHLTNDQPPTQTSDGKLRHFQKRMLSMHKRQSESDFEEVEGILRNVESRDNLTAYELCQINLYRPQIEFVVDKPVMLQPGAVLFTAGAGSVSQDWIPAGSQAISSPSEISKQDDETTPRPSYLANITSVVQGCPFLVQTSNNIKIKVQVNKVQVTVQMPKLLRYISLHLEDKQLFLHSMAIYSSTHTKQMAMRVNELAKSFLTFISTFLLLPNLNVFVNLAVTVASRDENSCGDTADSDTDLSVSVETPRTCESDCIKLYLKINVKDVIADVVHLKCLMLQCIGAFTSSTTNGKEESKE